MGFMGRVGEEVGEWDSGEVEGRGGEEEEEERKGSMMGWGEMRMEWCMCI